MIKIRGIQEEDFVNYKKCSMFIALGDCDWKCCKEAHIPLEVCQNSHLAQTFEKCISVEAIYNTYINNELSEAIVIGGLEPFTRKTDVLLLLKYFRNNNCTDDFIIYTGYTQDELDLDDFKKYNNVIVKFGRYVPNQLPHFDEVLGVNLASDNQYAVRIS